MSYEDVRLQTLGERLEALAAHAQSCEVPTLEARQQLDCLRQQCEGLREDLDAVAALGATAVTGMTVIIEQALEDLERASQIVTARANQMPDLDSERSRRRRPATARRRRAQ
jgi:hypothetical protein